MLKRTVLALSRHFGPNKPDKLSIFYLLFFGCLCYQLTRRNLPFAGPSLVEELSMDKSQLGLLESTLALSFSVGKLVGGIATDYYPSSYLFSVGLLIVAASNVIFGLGSSTKLFVVCWTLNGLSQGGMGWPPVAKLMTTWYLKEERATWWSAISTSSNIGSIFPPFLPQGGALIALVGSASTAYLGWRWTMIFPGILCLFGGWIMLLWLQDSPDDDDEGRRLERVPSDLSMDREPYHRVLMVHIVGNRSFWLLAVAGLLQYAIRTGILAWGILMMVESKGFSTLEAGACLFWFEIGGLLGGLAAGIISDRFLQGNRTQVIAYFMVMLFWKQKEGYFAVSVIVFFTGFCIYGPQVLLGVLATELVHKRAIGTGDSSETAGTAVGISGVFAGIGGTLAGFPCSIIIQNQRYGWDGFMFMLALCAALSTMIMLRLEHVTSTPVPPKPSKLIA